MGILGLYPSSHSTSVPPSAPPENLRVLTNVENTLVFAGGYKSKGDMSDITGQGIRGSKCNLILLFCSNVKKTYLSGYVYLAYVYAQVNGTKENIKKR